MQNKTEKPKPVSPLAFTHNCLAALPPLGWLFEFDAKAGAKLLCGSSVVIHENGFREGCWIMREGQDPTEIASLFGSGMEIRNGCWLFLTASHTLESLFLYRHSSGWSVSNSLSFLVAHHRLQMPWDARYGAKFATICHGIDAYEKSLFRTPEGEVLRLAYDNIELESNGDFRLLRKPMPPEFRDFDGYTAYLRETLRVAFDDAGHRGYRPLATCSSGYDSACATVLAAGLGCREAVTLKNARHGDDDSGRPIGELLGLKVHEFDRPENVGDNFEHAAEFLVCGMGGEDYCYRNFAPVLRRSVLLTGFHGDKSWEITSRPDYVLGRADLCGCSLHEFRLWNDFIHIPVPTIGTRRHPEVVALSGAAEMVPYRLNNGYDRPIPRRIIEEAGVPRSLFGQKKKAASILLFFEPRLFPPAVRRQYESVVPKEWTRASKFGKARLCWEFRYISWRILRSLDRRGGWRIPGLRRLKNKVVHPWRIFEHSHPRAVLEFLAALHFIGNRYRRALGAQDTAA